METQWMKILISSWGFQGLLEEFKIIYKPADEILIHLDISIMPNSSGHYIHRCHH